MSSQTTAQAVPAEHRILVNTVCIGLIKSAQQERHGEKRGLSPEQHYQEVRRKCFDISITHGDGRREVVPPPPIPDRRKP